MKSGVAMFGEEQPVGPGHGAVESLPERGGEPLVEGGVERGLVALQQPVDAHERHVGQQHRGQRGRKPHGREGRGDEPFDAAQGSASGLHAHQAQQGRQHQQPHPLDQAEDDHQPQGQGRLPAHEAHQGREVGPQGPG
ncbi:MAG: hypothetical protein Q9O62_08020 [Ardenticatenia bacterium]|nr:hypothetical protein [Ardenticatenia bacterium]